MKPPRVNREWIGLTVRTKHPLRTGEIVVPAGTVCKVEYAWGGLELTTEPCKCCGVAVRMKKVQKIDVEIVTCPSTQS